jgi:thiol-disulfide isomerase/thioredoxin
MRYFLVAAILSGVSLTLAALGGGMRAASDAPAAPAFTHRGESDWLNSPPLALKALRGKVVLLEFWTFDCHNCYRTVPWLNALDAQLRSRGLHVVGVHTPEFAHERVRANVERKLAEYGIKHPVMLDNDFSYWNAFSNRYWPAFYLLDKRGRVRAHYAGETHSGDAQARRMEADITALLDEAQ